MVMDGEARQKNFSPSPWSVFSKALDQRLAKNTPGGGGALW